MDFDDIDFELDDVPKQGISSFEPSQKVTKSKNIVSIDLKDDSQPKQQFPTISSRGSKLKNGGTKASRLLDRELNLDVDVDDGLQSIQKSYSKDY